jgi:hypothetical protein
MLLQIVMRERKDSEIIGEAEILFRDKLNKPATPKGIKFIIKYFVRMLL